MLNITGLLLNLGRKSDQCKPPARFLLGWATAFKIKINYLQVFSMLKSHLLPV